MAKPGGIVAKPGPASTYTRRVVSAKPFAQGVATLLGKLPLSEQASCYDSLSFMALLKLDCAAARFTSFDSRHVGMLTEPTFMKGFIGMV